MADWLDVVVNLMPVSLLEFYQHNLSLLIVTHTRRHYSMEKGEQQDLTFPEKLFSDLQAYYPED